MHFPQVEAGKVLSPLSEETWVMVYGTGDLERRVTEFLPLLLDTTGEGP